jgi:predicted RNA binding protein YcfA (HicA-like mRNA interferase family)
MPNRLKSDISGKDILEFLGGHDFVLKRMKGSHMILKRHHYGQSQMLVIPDRKITPKGTLKAVINQSEKYISPDVLHDFFYTK